MNDLLRATASSIAVRVPSVIETDVDGELVLLDTEGGACCGLNKMGSHIWKLLEAPTRVSDLCVRLMSEFDVPADICEAQIIDFLNAMRGGGLVKFVEIA